MNEAQFNTIVRNSLSWAHKISDAGTHGKLPFDGFGMYGSKALYWESKLLPKRMAFNFSRLEEHQLEALREIKALGGDAVVTILLICVNYGRGDKRVFVYDDVEELARRKENKLSIKAEEFDNTPFVKIHKAKVDFAAIL